ncbi:MET7A protein, partial [Steatornis caripensis]|nr:MET7A protein [Steatornis caripensis]
LLIPFLQQCIQLLLLPIHVLVCLGLWDSVYTKIFPYTMVNVAPIYNHKVYKLFSNFRKLAGPSGQLTLLEIGTRTSTNLQFYPLGCRLTGTDTDPNFTKFLLKSLSENEHLELDHSVAACGEDLHQIPDSTVDVVACTLVLCSVTDKKKAVMEALRVLRLGSARQGGAFYLELVAADPSSWAYFWQKICDPAWKYFGDGCSSSRETQKELEEINFSELHLRCIHATPYWIPTSPHITGYAVK